MMSIRLQSEKLRRNDHHTTTIYLLQPPNSLSTTARPCIIATTHTTSTLQLHHPLTGKHQTYKFPTNFDLSKFHLTTLAVSYYSTSAFHKLIVFPPTTSENPNFDNHTLLELFDGGELRGRFRGSSPSSVKLTRRGSVDKFDDVIIFRRKIYVLDREGKLNVINIYKKSRKIIIGKTLITFPVTPGLGRFGWRKRLLVDGKQLYLVVRKEEKLLEVYKMVRIGNAVNWDKIEGFQGRKVLFMSRDCCFLTQAGREFPGREYKDCIVFSEGAFLSYGNGCWEVSQSGNEDDIAVFRLGDGSFAKEGENMEFPNISWSPPAWIFDGVSSSDAELQSRLSSESCSKSEREPEEDEGLESSSGDEKDGEMQSDLIGQDKEQEGTGSGSGSQYEEDGMSQCDSDSQEVEDEEMHCNANIEGGASLQGVASPSLFLHSTIVYFLHPPPSLSCPTSYPWIIAAINRDLKLDLRHPLTLNHQAWNLPKNFDLSKFHPSTLAVSIHFTSSFDKLLVVPTPTPKFDTILDYNYNNKNNFDDCTLLALYEGGKLRGCLPSTAAKNKSRLSTSPWVKLSCGSTVVKFDDLTIYKGKIYVLDREGKLYLISNYNNYMKSGKLSIGKALIDHPIPPGSGRFRWRKRLVIYAKQLYLVVRTEEKVFEVYMLISQRMRFSWNKVGGIAFTKVLFMARDYYFFLQAGEFSNFTGKEFKDCIVFTEGAFPSYGKDSWEFTQFGRQPGTVRKSEEDIAVFRFTDQTFARDGENAAFPKINWSPPPWVFDAWSGIAATLSQSSSESYCSRSEREPEEDEGLVSSSKDDKDEQMQSDFMGDDKEQQGMDSDSDGEDEDEKMQCDFSCRENEDEEVTRTLPSKSGGDDATEQGTSMKNVTQSIPRASSSCTTKSYESDSTTTKFEGFDVKSNLVPTLQKLWRKHGNIIENSTMRSGDIVARALESLATMVKILEDNSAQSLIGSQADYLSSTLSDLRCMCFKVNWLIPSVYKAVQLHKSKHLLDSLNNLRKLSSQANERRAILLDELAKLDEEDIKQKEEMTKLSKLIPFSGKVMFEEPLGLGLT